MPAGSHKALRAENEALRLRLGEAEQTLEAIRSGQVESLIVEGRDGPRIFSLEGAWRSYRVLVEAMNEGAATLGEDGAVYYCNLRFAQMLEAPLERVMGASLRPFLAEGSRERFDALVRDARGGHSRGELELLTTTGQRVPAHLSISPIEDEERRLCCVATDLRDQKRNEEIVRAERLARSVLEQAAEAIVVCDERGRIIRASSAAAELCGRDPLLTPFDATFPVQVEQPQALLAPSVATSALNGQFLRAVPAWLDRAGGARAHLVVSAAPLAGDEGRFVGCVITMTDLTERRRAEEERAGLEAQLHQASKMESVGRLAGGVAHEFNNMLGVILGYTDMALGALDPAEPLRADLEEVRKAARRSADLTRQLLAFARKQPAVPRVLDLNETVGGMLNMLRRLIGENIRLVWKAQAGLWAVKVDPSQVDQMLANLCINARDAIADVGEIAIEVANCGFDGAFCATHPGFLPGEYVRLTVRDDGAGMDEETRAHLFEPFFTTKALGKGTGLGLATVYGAVMQNKGFVQVSTAVGQGTSFAIHLPRHVDASERAPAEAKAEPSPPGHETVLVVEDEQAILRLARRVLQRQGYAVLAANGPVEALRLAAGYEGELHLLVTDVVMPEMNGRDLARRLKELRPNVKALFMSGYPAEVIAQDGFLEPGVSFLQKPFTAPELAAKVRAALD
jgi:PAS domain S-box-containing protein